MAAQQPAGSGISHTARPQAEDWVLANQHLRVVLRSDNLTLSVEDLATQEMWGSDPWEASSHRFLHPIVGPINQGRDLGGVVHNGSLGAQA